jgi:hypothetical protein
MSFIASMVAASAASAGLVTAGGIGAAALGAAATGAAGAGIGAGVSALTGGDVGEGALMGGIGGLGAGAGAALSGATMGASAIGAEGAAATPFAAAAPVASTPAATAAPVVENAGLQSSGVVTQGLGANTAPITGEVTSGSLTAPGTVNSVVAPATNPALTSAANPAPVVQGPVQASQGALDPTTFAAKNVAANEANASWGSQLLSKAGIADAGQTGNAIGGKALENAVYGAGINGLLAGAQGQDVGKAMGRGAISGGIGGAAAGGLGQMGGSIGEFATAHPNITSGAIGMGANMALGNIIPDSSSGIPELSPLKSKYRWNPDAYNAYLPRGNSFGSFAAGGITDLDNYDQTPQMQNPGTLDIPNRNEVSNNQGYMGDSVQLMAKGGLSYGGGGLLGSPMLDMGIVSALPQGSLSFLPESGIDRDAYNMTAGRFLSPDLADHLFKSQDDANKDEKDAKDKEEKIKATLYKQKVMQQLAQQGQARGMAHGGISDLGGYSDGGRLLKGPGDGVSDDIPASIGGKQPARLAEGEFVIPARIVSELGNGSTDAGAKRLYQMMDRIQSDRRKTTGKGKFSDDPKAYKHLPA